MSSKLRVVLSVVAFGVLFIPARQASAAIYEVHACRLPTGATAPANGWVATTGAIATLNCPGGSMTVRTQAGESSPGWHFGLSFTAPRGTYIAGYRQQVDGEVVQVAGGPPPWSWNYGEAGILVGEDQLKWIRVISGNGGPFADSYDYPLGTHHLSQLQLMLECSNADYSAPCQDNGSHFNLRQIAVKLDDAAPPRILSSSGSLLDNSAPQRGERHVSLNLADVGSGLYRTHVLVDGERMEDRPIDDNEGACKRPFVMPVPCKLTGTVDVPVDTTRLTEGPHAISVRVFDATGVNSAVVGPVSIVVDNEPDPPTRGTVACPPRSVAKLRRRLKSRVVRYGRSTAILGRVLTSRTSLKGAHVGVVDNPALNAPPRLARVGRHGRFRIKVRPMRSTRLQPILVSATGVAQACGKPLKLAVRAGVRLTTTPRHLRNGQSIRMHGRVVNVQLPQQGKTVAIQARARGAASWTTVTLIRSDRVGEFSFAYRFRKTFRTTTYEFRAVAPRERGYPYLRGWSRTRRATVSP